MPRASFRSVLLRMVDSDNRTSGDLLPCPQRPAGRERAYKREFAMPRIITIEADFDRPIDLQLVQEASASWNGQTVELTLNLVLQGRLEIFRAPITVEQAQLFQERLQAALNRASSGQ